MIGRAELSRMASRSGVGERVQEKDYVLAWLLRAAAEDADERIVFKGGTALRRCYFDDYRLSEDLDFTVTDGVLRAALDQIVAGWCETISDLAGIDAAALPDSEDPTERFWVSYTGPLLARREAEIKLDFAFDERILTSVEYPTIRSDYTDLPSDTFALPTYSLVEIWGEKVRSLLQRAQPRDVYDLVALARTDPGLAVNGFGVFASKTRDKGLDPNRLAARIAAVEGKMRDLWGSLLANQMAELEPFDSVWRELKRTLRGAGYI